MKQSNRALACLLLSMYIVPTLRAANSKEEIMRSLATTNDTFANNNLFNLSQEPVTVQKWSQIIQNVQDYTNKYAHKDKTLLKELGTITSDFDTALASIKEGYILLEHKLSTDSEKVNRIGKKIQTIIKNMERTSSTLHTKTFRTANKKNVRSVLMQAAEYVYSLARNAGLQLTKEWYTR